MRHIEIHEWLEPFMTDLYQRPAVPNGALFRSEADARREEEAARIVAAVWRCRLRPIPDPTFEVDYWAERDGMMLGWIEMKARSVPWGKYPTVVLNYRRYCKIMAQRAHPYPQPAYVVWRFADGSYWWVDLDDVDASAVIQFARREARTVSDVNEPTIFIPNARFRSVFEPPVPFRQ